MSTGKTEKNAAMYIRVPLDLREAIEKSASDNERTLNGEIIFRLREAYGMRAAKKAAPGGRGG